MSIAVAAVMSDLRLQKDHNAVQLSAGHLHWCLAGLNDQDSLSATDALRLVEANLLAEWRDGQIPFPIEQCAAANGVARIAGTVRLQTIEDAMTALEKGPILAFMDIYEDFWRYYASGHYHHVAGRCLGLHPVAVVGCDRDRSFWVIKNSLGTSWGDVGYARIMFGQCRLFTEDGAGGAQLILA